MKRASAVLAASAVVLGFTVLAHAAKLVSPFLSVDEFTSGVCYIRNTGSTAVTVTVALFAQDGTSVATFDGCNDGGQAASLPPGQTCMMLATDLSDVATIACSVTAGNVSRLRGALEVRNLGAVVRTIISEELR
jgi:hypothetical protein